MKYPQFTRRQILIYAGLWLTQHYPYFIQSVKAQISKQSEGPHYFDGKLTYFFDILGRSVDATLDAQLDGGRYFTELRVFKRDTERTVLYQQSSEGTLEKSILLPAKAVVRRNFDYWELNITGYNKNDEFILDFKYGNGKLIGVKPKIIRYKAGTLDRIEFVEEREFIPYESHNSDLLATIIQIVWNLRSKQAPKTAISVIDKSGNPTNAKASADNGVISLDFRGQAFDFSEIRIKYDDKINPLEITIKELYKRANFYAKTGRNIE